MNAAVIIILLISPDYLASQHCYEHEMQPALARATTGSARLIPILLRPTDQDISPLACYKPLPSNGIPVSRWPRRDDALLEVARGIRLVIEELVDTRTLNLTQFLRDEEAKELRQRTLQQERPLSTEPSPDDYE